MDVVDEGEGVHSGMEQEQQQPEGIQSSMLRDIPKTNTLVTVIDRGDVLRIEAFIADEHNEDGNIRICFDVTKTLVTQFIAEHLPRLTA